MKTVSVLLLVLAVLFLAGLFYVTWLGWNKPVPVQIGHGFSPAFFNFFTVLLCAMATVLVLVGVMLYNFRHELADPIGEVDKSGTLILSVFVCETCQSASRRMKGWRCPKCGGKRSKKATFRIPA